jgi:hypothetical protein
MTKYAKYGVPIIDKREKRGELNVPIEDFDEKLNDAEALEIYTEEKYADKAISLIEDFNEKNFYNDCIFQSRNYEEASNIQMILIKNEIPCGDVVTNFLYDDTEEYLIFLDPEFHVKTENILKNNFKQEIPVEKRDGIKQNEDIQFSQVDEWRNPFVSFFKFSFIISIIIIFIYFLDKKHPFIDKVLNLVTELIKNIKQ